MGFYYPNRSDSSEISTSVPSCWMGNEIKMWKEELLIAPLWVTLKSDRGAGGLAPPFCPIPSIYEASAEGIDQGPWPQRPFPTHHMREEPRALVSRDHFLRQSLLFSPLEILFHIQHWGLLEGVSRLNRAHKFPAHTLSPLDNMNKIAHFLSGSNRCYYFPPSQLILPVEHGKASEWRK